MILGTQTLGIVWPPGPVPANASEDVTGPSGRLVLNSGDHW